MLFRSRLYENLFSKEDLSDLGEGENFLDYINPGSAEVVNGYVEPSLAMTPRGERFQFERLGYFYADSDSTAQKLVVNRTATLRDTWAKIEKKM